MLAARDLVVSFYTKQAAARLHVSLHDLLAAVSTFEHVPAAPNLIHRLNSCLERGCMPLYTNRYHHEPAPKATHVQVMDADSK